MKDGFCLKKFEILNWGTFDNEVETFLLDDDITVVSGDNGSGKSTVVDALVSLLVPNRMRKYNLSATDGNAKKSRSEITYVRGAYKNQETADGVKTAFLRGNDAGFFTYSILLGYFLDEGSGKELTLVSFFKSNTTDSVEKFSCIAQSELSIERDILSILRDEQLPNPVTKLKASLKARTGTKLYDTFDEYKQDYSHFFWLRGNAIDLFNKVVSLKEIKDLSSFLKENMLETNEEIVREFQECEKNYLGVKDIYENIIASEKKLEILVPFMEQKKEYSLRQEGLREMIYLEENFRHYAADREVRLIGGSLVEKQKERERKGLEQAVLRAQKYEQEEEKRKIENLIDSSDFAKRIRELQATKELHRREKVIREKNLTEYLGHLGVLKLPFDKTADGFESNLLQIGERYQGARIAKENAEKAILEISATENASRKILSEVRRDLEYFRSRQNLLPRGLSEIRKNICRNLAIDEWEIPFVCELIKVRDSEKPWAMAIEKLLHSFGQELLVPDVLIERVNRFVDSNNLKGKLKYNRVLTHADAIVPSEEDSRRVISKLDIAHNCGFEHWLRQSFATKFDYVCLEGVESEGYSELAKVLTLSGLIKTKMSFLKDDREFTLRDFILGWDNKPKIAELEKEEKQEEKRLEKIERELAALRTQIISSEETQKIIAKLESIRTFADVDSVSIDQVLHEVCQEIERIERSDTSMQSYKLKGEEIRKKIDRLEADLERLIKDMGILEEDIRKYEARKAVIWKLLEHVNMIDIVTKFSGKYELVSTTLEALESDREEIITLIRRRKDSIQEQMKTIENKMNGYASTYKENRMTVSEKNEISSNATQEDFREYLEREYQKVNNEELYKYKQKFEKEFRDNLFSRLNDFYHSLENEQSYILSKIAEINATLKTITYSSETYIEIAPKDNNKKWDGIEDFKREFRDKVINKRELDMNDKMKAFENIKNLMERLIVKENEDWVVRVIDVRNWFLFTIKERYIRDDLVKDIYESSSGKSGGQTIKLAYGVLAAALLYQYGIREQDANLLSSGFSKSFRLVVIDEVFAKLDIDNSRYVLDLFAKLGLQLFIITPTNTINVLEDYVKTIYFISNQTGEKSYKNKIDIVSREILP